MVFLRIDPNDPVPLGAQIVRGIRLAVGQGRIAPGERLPSARELAATLQVNFHTVRKAYGELEADGVLSFQRGRGTFVSADAKRLRASDLQKVVREHVQRLVEDLAGSDVDPDALAETVAEELRKAVRGRNQQGRRNG
ncbi:MAG: GntR family transcriptional regulator [Planctomycetes bacterium]|nr:GntR family transcriptional regulator [Planctomycetota bacterium]